jgi:hypothetical protein
MGKKGVAGSLWGLYDLVLFPWERLILLSCLALGLWWLYGKVSRCQAEVNAVVREATTIVNSSPCNEQREIFRRAINCEEYARKLEPEYQEEVWWTCFLNTFIFYRSWVGLAIFAVAVYAVVAVCRVPKYKPPKAVIRSQPRIRYYPDPPLLEYPEERRSPRKRRSRETSYESSSDDDYDQ